MQSTDHTNSNTGYQYSNDETEAFSSSESTTADNYQVASAPDHSTVDAFEYEPMGYMSKGRW
jgi:hypothetical protein